MVAVVKMMAKLRVMLSLRLRNCLDDGMGKQKDEVQVRAYVSPMRVRETTLV